jgi:DNA repair protein RecO (recombination protein O)
MALYRDQGVVLRTWKLGEADRIVSILTREHGKVRAVAKGVRKQTSRFGSRLEPTAHLSLQLYAGRGDLDTVTQVESLHRFATLRNDLDQWARACAMLEAVDQACPDREPNEGVFDMLVRALGTLEARPTPLVVAAFFLKLLAREGFEPLVDACVVCGADEPLTGFSVSDGGTTCEACRRGPLLSPDGRAVLGQILGGRLGAALNLPASAVADEVDRIATNLLEHHFDRRLRSIGVLGRH